MPLDQYKVDSSRGQQVRARFESLKHKQKSDLQQIVKRYSKVVDVRGTPKDWLISEILESEFGRGYSEYL